LRRRSFFAVSAFKFTNADGTSRYGRYRVLPVAGNEYLDETEAAGPSPNFLFDEIKDRVAKEPVRFRVVVQLAEDGDIIDNATVAQVLAQAVGPLLSGALHDWTGNYVCSLRCFATLSVLSVLAALMARRPMTPAVAVRARSTIL
jgi:hypothetical protein